MSAFARIRNANRVDKISTADLIRALCDDDEKPWATYNRGKPISPRQVSKRLSEYGIKSKTVRIGYTTAKGFELDQFKDAFARYLSVSPLEKVTTSQPTAGAASSVADKKTLPSHANLSVTASQNVTDKTSRYGNENQKVTLQPTAGAACDVVTDKTGKTEEKITRRIDAEDRGTI